MIYSASRRTDLARFHPDWLAERIARSRRLEAVVYWTKDPTPLVEHPGLIRALERYPSLVQVTITGHGGDAWEPGAPPPEKLAASLSLLARRLPAGAVLWRFDPLILDATDPKPAESLLSRFDAVRALWAGALGPPREVTTSFLAPYSRVRQALDRAGLCPVAPASTDRLALLKALWRRLGDPEAVLRLCCVPEALDLPFVRPARCIDAPLLDRLYGTKLADLPRDAGQRAACTCARSTDIGAYAQFCGHGCVYCYANHGDGTTAGSGARPGDYNKERILSQPPSP